MSEIKDGGPAFACASDNGHQVGMSLRDYFAAQALPSIWSSAKGGMEHRYMAAEAYSLADAMLHVRNLK